MNGSVFQVAAKKSKPSTSQLITADYRCPDQVRAMTAFVIHYCIGTHIKDILILLKLKVKYMNNILIFKIFTTRIKELQTSFL